MADAAKSLDVHVNTLHGWVRSAREHGLESPRRRSAEQEEIARLRRELPAGRGYLVAGTDDTTPFTVSNSWIIALIVPRYVKKQAASSPTSSRA